MRLCLLLLLVSSLTIGGVAQTYRIVLDGEDPSFSVKSGDWELDKTGSFLYNYKFSCAGPGTGSSLAVWTIDGIPAGTYTVEYYVDNGNYAQNAQYVIESATGTTTMTASQNYVSTGWHTLGQFQFERAGRITQTDYWTGAGTKVIADALRLTLQGTPQVSTLNVVPPEISVVIDDMGSLDPSSPSSYTYQLFHQAPRFGYAIIPFTSLDTEVLQAAAAAGIETLTHQPMQYIGQADTNPSDQTRLYIGMNDDQISAALHTTLGVTAPYAIGMNNHQGSRFSEYAHGMELVVDELKARGQFYYDSRTISDSVGYDVAKRRGVLTAERDLFIDGNTPQETHDFIVSLAMQAKYAPNCSFCGIGHPRTYTVPGIPLALATMQTMGVGVRPISRQMTYVMEPDNLPIGATITPAGLWQQSDNDLISQECSDGFAYMLIGEGGSSARYTPDLPRAGAYRVFVGYSANSHNCDQVRVRVHGRGGDSVFMLNQQLEPNRWHYIGSYNFDAGTSGYVVLDNPSCSNPAHVVQADAIKWVSDGPITTAAADWQLY